MAITSKQRRELLKFIKKMEPIRGRHTELVSVYIPAGYELVKIIQQLAQEQGTAVNIKDATTRKNVGDSLERMIQHLRLFKKTPVHGLAVFAGNVAERAGQQNIEVFSLEPPEPLNFRLYRCDKTFMLDVLKDMSEKKDTYGLIVMDKREGNIALLKGKTILPLTKTTSYVPGKTRAGGQCVIPSTLIQSVQGDIFEIEKSHNPNIIMSSMIKELSIQKTPITDKWNTKKDSVYRIITKNPRLEIECSKDHVFFAREEEIIEKPAEELIEGGLLLMPEKIDIKGKLQQIDSLKYQNSFTVTPKGRDLIKKERESRGLFQKQLAKRIGYTQTAISTIELGKRNVKRDFLKKLCRILDLPYNDFISNYAKPFNQYGVVNLPSQLDEDFAQFLGYYMGDGSIEKDRITFFEQRKDVALYYKKKYDDYFDIDCSYKFRKSKNYHQLRFTSRPLVRLVKNEFPELKKALNSKIPIKILESQKDVVASFLKGFFDAEGYVNAKRGVGLGINNKKLAQQLQMLLFRFSIIGSLNEYGNRANIYSNNMRYTVNLTEKKSLNLFKKYIGFTSKTSYSRQIAVSGKKIRKIIEKAGYNMELFPRVTNFFRDERMMSKQTYHNSILKVVKNKDSNLYKKLKKYYDSPVLSVKIDKIEIKNKKTDMVDISTEQGNFIANGLIVHNSSQRFERLREGAAKEFFSKLGEYVKEQFLERKEIKGIIVGGPGHTKNEFVDGNYITDQVKRKIIAIKDLSYTGEFGLNELVDKSQDVLANEEISKEKDIMQKFFDMLSKKPKQVAYGQEQVKKALEQGAVKHLLLSEDVDDDTVEEFEILAEQYKTNVEIISVETREGVQLRDMGKFAAILRYEMH